jgi:ribosomal protein S27E
MPIREGEGSMKINCLSCGHSLGLDEEVYSDYEGQVKCWSCGALLEVKLEEGRLKSVKSLKLTSSVLAEL